MLYNNLIPLEWDTRFFGYSVAKINLNHEGIEKINNLFNQIAIEKIHLTYIFVSPDDSEIIGFLEKKRCALVDQKTTFSKKAENRLIKNNEIFEFRKKTPTVKLKKLALLAGQYSRFQNDENFKNNEYERLYIEWLNNSLLKKLAKKTFIAKRMQETIGFTTLNYQNNYAEIGLIAVDRKFQGMGVGSDLIYKTENEAVEIGFNELRVVTQLNNKAACRLYEKCDFTKKEVTNIFHFWQQ